MLGNRHYQDSFRAIQNSSKNHKSSLDLAISAVSNIFLSFLSRRPELEELGEEQFAVAVSLTRAALDDPTKITSDSTLISILLLSNFRSVMAYRSPVIMHYIGLAQILRARGPDYCNTEISQLCLQQVSGRLVDAVLGGSFIETNQLLEASRLLPKPVPDIEESPIVLLSSFVPHINQLRLKMESVSLGMGFDAEIVADILSFALETESELSKWPEMVNPTCQPMLSASLLSEFQSKCPHHPAETYYPQWADEYPSLIISQIWNSYRCLRIMVNTCISRCAALTRNYSLATSTEQICQEMVDNFCASVPFHIGSLSSRHASHPGNVQGNTSPSKLAALGAMLLMPKLRWIVGQHLTLRGGQMEWLQLQLSDVLQFYRMHGVRMSDDVATRASPILAQ
ncbi:hypothetical protein BGW36DRAFT_290522 [Talaromyces proteolyticus]|uniref:Transcription factor domain-containing protein n=1 Tax=Talaromyces proteolyticus TaxID=1131652 RepID=A0AAD4KY32_9EURO|nr:uncharacterized protein BGW36DRAFT_290522 [Talaromyces proteolyticus]KAH8701657.1 hypothetical protein BGW36DRAFT_290522 [Talaromyces proteolyticus]